MKEITLAQFIEGYQRDGIYDVIVVKEKIYGKTREGQAGKSSHIVVFAVLP